MVYLCTEGLCTLKDSVPLSHNFDGLKIAEDNKIRKPAQVDTNRIHWFEYKTDYVAIENFQYTDLKKGNWIK